MSVERQAKLRSLIAVLQKRVDIYNQWLAIEQALILRFNAYSAPDRAKDEAHAIRLQYNEAHYQKKLAGGELVEAKMDLYNNGGEDDRLWPPHLRLHHPKTTASASSCSSLKWLQL
jgi:hypothetical protein